MSKSIESKGHGHLRKEAYVAGLVAVLLLGAGVSHAAFYRTEGGTGFLYGDGYSSEEGYGFGYGYLQDELNGTTRTADHGFVEGAGAATGFSATAKATSVTVSYTGGYLATNRVDYGTSSGNLNQSTSWTSEQMGSNTIKISGLSCNTTYYYRVTSMDSGENLWHTSQSSIKTSKCSSGGGGGSRAGAVSATTGDPAALLASLQAQLAALLAQAGGAAVTTDLRDLTVGMTGTDVGALQRLLIAQGHSIPAGATSYFGSQTQAALAAYQTAHGITPAAGYFGPVTRAQMKAAGLAGLWW